MNETQNFSLELKKEFEARKLKNGNYSLRSFARQLGIQPAATSEFIKGQRKASPKMVERIGNKLLWSHPKIEHLKMNRTRVTVLEPDEFDLIANWYHFAILALLETNIKRLTVNLVAKRFGLNSGLAQKALATLRRLGLVNSKYELNDQTDITTTDDIAVTAIQKNHLEGLELAGDKLLSTHVLDREYSALTMAIDPAQIPKLKKEMRKFRKKVEDICRSGEKTEVYRFNMQLFPLTNLKNQKRTIQ